MQFERKIDQVGGLRDGCGGAHSFVPVMTPRSVNGSAEKKQTPFFGGTFASAANPASCMKSDFIFKCIYFFECIEYIFFN